MNKFKANPSAYAESGALVTVHNRPRLRVVPIVSDDPERLTEIKARLRLLGALASPDEVERERRALAADRDADRLAAHAVSVGASLITADTGFTRFAELDVTFAD
ncbi:type II toxin-antitoxin system VapC family toxin [Microbacterium protaetiae]|nr:type II toxin-antitoxin system VapC family toxin [Microbacterium protaetiae]